YAIPIVAVCLNFSWEAIFAVFRPPLTSAGDLDLPKLSMFIGWMVIDAIIVYQCFRYGKQQQTVAAIKRFFNTGLVICLLIAAVWMWTFTDQIHDSSGHMTAYTINLIMSMLFVDMFFRRPDLRNHSYSGAWLKFFATGVISLANGIVMAEKGVNSYFLFLMISVFTFDLLYILLLRQARNQTNLVPA
ncbi:MAG: hypothetical protein OEM51_14235, partial [Gammaproteobacteria bacterium]|nr:hypothetical protein [Gammaproteobacteria bacterium]